MNWWRALFAMVQKDIRIEARAKTLYISALVFGALLVLLFGFAVGGAVRMPAGFTSGSLWLIVFVSALLSFNRQDDKERWDDALSGALAAPVDRSAVFCARLIANALFVAAVEAAILPLFFMVFGLAPPAHAGAFAAAVALGTWTFVALGTFLTAVGAASSLREILVPVMLLPLSIPLFLALVTLTDDALARFAPVQSPAGWWVVLAAYALLFTALPGLLFEYLVEV